MRLAVLFLANNHCDLEEKVSVKIFNDLDKNKTTQI